MKHRTSKQTLSVYDWRQFGGSPQPVLYHIFVMLGLMVATLFALQVMDKRKEARAGASAAVADPP